MRLLAKLRSAIQGRQKDRELGEELRFHVERRSEELQREARKPARN